MMLFHEIQLFVSVWCLGSLFDLNCCRFTRIYSLMVDVVHGFFCPRVLLRGGSVFAFLFIAFVGIVMLLLIVGFHGEINQT